MPKHLSKSPPSSSVARLLDIQAASRAVTTVSELRGEARLEAVRRTDFTEPTQPTPAKSNNDLQLVNDPRHHKRELVLSQSTEETLTKLVEIYRRCTGTRLSASHVARAMLRGISKCIGSLDREASEIGQLKLPSNARGREGERDRFEDAIAQAFINGIRGAAAYRREE